MVIGLFDTYIDVPSNAVLLEGRLEYLIIIGVLIVMLGLPVHFAHLHCARVYSINHLTVHSPCRTLFHLLETKLLFHTLNLVF